MSIVLPPLELTGLIMAAVLAIGTAAGVIKNWEVITIWWKKVQEKRRMSFSKKQQPYCALVCSAPSAMSEILIRLDQMFYFIQVTREISLETHGMALIDKCKSSIEKGFMEQAEKDDIIHSFIPYVIGDGNGKVFNYVQMAMNMPTHQGGQSCDVDLSAIVEREIDRYKRKQEAQRKE